MIRTILTAAVVLLIMIGQLIFYRAMDAHQPHCPSIEITERPGPQPDLFKRTPPQGVKIYWLGQHENRIHTS